MEPKQHVGSSESYWEDQYPGEVVRNEELVEINLKEILKTLLSSM